MLFNHEANDDADHEAVIKGNHYEEGFTSQRTPEIRYDQSMKPASTLHARKKNRAGIIFSSLPVRFWYILSRLLHTEEAWHS